MKSKLLILLTTLLASLCIASGASAAGGISVSRSNLAIVKGNSGSFSVTATNAAGRVDISSSNNAVATVSESSVFLDNNSQSVSVKAVGAGSAKITIKVIDAATYDGGSLNGKTYTVSVSVSKPSKSTTPSKSANNDLKSLTVEGYKLETTDRINYSLTVENSVKKIKISAVADDSKATLSGTGEKTVNVGANTYTITVTAENGSARKYKVVVIRKNAAGLHSTYYLPDINDALDNGQDDVSIVVGDGDVIDEISLEKIQESGKNVNIVKYDDEDKVSYSVSIDGSKIQDFEKIDIDSLVVLSDKEQPDEKTGSDSGIYVTLSSASIPNGSKLKINVSNNYEDGSEVNVYSYDGGKIVTVGKALKVEDGMVEFDLTGASEYFVTTGSAEAGGNMNIVLALNILGGAALLTSVIAIVIALATKKRGKKGKKEKDGDTKAADGAADGDGQNEAINPFSAPSSTPNPFKNTDK